MRLEDLRFLDPHGEIDHTSNRLPHWQQGGKAYFVTFHLGDAISRVLLDRWEEEKSIWLGLHPEPWTPEVEREYHTRFSARIEQCLDDGHGSCLLRDPACAKLICRNGVEVLRGCTEHTTVMGGDAKSRAYAVCTA